ncbi:dinitrogenase iron-molybdenum cofactor biosynthesis protein [Solemya velesiana gill symbiont]|uniref:Dinitrogenase iron-molybdenum cofactor biosynthesis protein n=1 Tax=Solemya velesiana gill symbiont TaxID=1918948 RepID=A0A1T2KVH7_9GAMM|nr:dinitrogenase iron-molybdenum cofactor biosynthesis protein [Solemya velesiana gill symbiont]OOZ36849.1 dinitrogenase iron-molybdenum cofactor biosynthesis protein [Solemya velesiana gill symbiont]
MNATPISNEIALRIGLAARELPDTDAARLLRVLADAVGLPPTEKKLSGLTVKAFKAAQDGEFADADSVALKSALGYLKGENTLQAEPLPEIESYSEGDMPGSIRVACASNKSEMLDGHFGSCKRFLIYQVSESENRLVEIREIDDAEAEGDKNGYRASLIADCQVLFVASIGGPAAAKVVRAGAHPIKKPQMGEARDEILKLQRVIGSKAPPWLAKVMGQSPEERIRFEQEEATA